MSNAHQTITDLINQACRHPDPKTAGELALKAVKSIKAVGASILVPAGKTLPGLKGESTGRYITSKYSGTCAECGKPYSEGDEVYWIPGSSTFHADCAREQGLA